jgi:hypothetical protein
MTHLKISRHVFEKIQMSYFMKIRPFGVELLHADGGTDKHNEVNRLFPRFCDRAKKTCPKGHVEHPNNPFGIYDR